jgi:tetratricopeptide (TPR) repeat protein
LGVNTARLLRYVALGVLALAGRVAAAPGSAPARSPATRASTSTAPATRASRDDRQRLMQLMRKSIELFKTKQYDEIEKLLTEALSIDPQQPTNLYNMACVKALTRRADQAMDYLEKAAEAGFTDFVHINRDSDLESLRTLDRYKALMGRKDEIQRRAADRTLAALKRQLRAGYLFEIDEQAKLVFATNTDQATLVALKKTLGAQARSLWQQVFDHKPDQYISVVLPSMDDYRRMVPMPGVGGFYNGGSRILTAMRMGQIMAHEFTHALHDADKDAVGQEHPIWLVEGLAVVFESATFEGDSLVPRDNHRLPYLQAAARRDRLIALEKLLKMDQRAFISQAVLAYGQSGSVLLWLAEQGLLKKFYQTYKGGFEKDATGKAALEATLGKKLAQIESEWKQWMSKRTPPPVDTGPGGAFVGVRFGQGNDGLRIEDVVKDGPAENAGIKVGDVVVGLEGVDVRDYASVVPMLKAHQPGDKVTFKVRRGEEYLDVGVVLAKRPAPATASATRPATPGTRPSTRPRVGASRPTTGR